MFLLILSECCRQCGITLFTFHDVSINTETDPDGFMSIPDFTFHDVSINTCESRRAL